MTHSWLPLEQGSANSTGPDSQIVNIFASVGPHSLDYNYSDLLPWKQP